MDRILFKSNAKDQLRGKWGLAIKVFFILTLLNLIDSSLDASYKFELFKVNENISRGIKFVNYIFEGVLQVGVCRFALNIAIDKENVSLIDAFSGFNVYFKAVAIYLIKLVCTIIGYFLLIVPGIIIDIMFSQAFYILCEDNSKEIIECLKESARMMQGYKWDYFVLGVSFIGWNLLGFITLGLANFILNPYIETTYANYYLELKRRM